MNDGIPPLDEVNERRKNTGNPWYDKYGVLHPAETVDILNG